MPSSAHSPDYQIFLERLRAVRMRAKLTQAEVARRLGKPQSYVSKSESGERRVDAAELAAFAAVYGVPVKVLLPPRTRGRS